MATVKLNSTDPIPPASYFNFTLTFATEKSYLLTWKDTCDLGLYFYKFYFLNCLNCLIYCTLLNCNNVARKLRWSLKEFNLS